MKTWDASKSKFYSEIMGWTCNMLGLTDSATEAEVHQATVDMTDTLATIREQANTLAVQAVKDQLADFQSQITANTTSIEQLTAAAAEKDGQITTLNTTVTELQDAIKAKETEISTLTTAHTAKVTELSGEISRLKAGRPLEEDAESDTLASELGNGGGKAGGTVIKNSAMGTWLKNGSTAN